MLAISVGVVTAGVVTTGLVELHAAEQAYRAHPAVLVAAADLAAGTALTAELVRVEHLPARVTPTDPLVDLAALDGPRIVRTPVLAGTVLTERHLGPAFGTPAGARAVAVRTEGDLALGVGATVDLVGLPDPFGGPMVVAGAVVGAVSETDRLDGTRSITVWVPEGELGRVAQLAATGPVVVALAG